jgi:hypothetical protein
LEQSDDNSWKLFEVKDGNFVNPVILSSLERKQ